MYIRNVGEARNYLEQESKSWVLVCKQTGNWVNAGTDKEHCPEPGFPTILYAEESFGKGMAMPIDFTPLIRHLRLTDKGPTVAKNICLACNKHRALLDDNGLCGDCRNKALVIKEGEPVSVPTQAVKGETGADTIAARESVYGPFHVHAKAEQDIKKAMMSQPGWDKLNDVQKSAAEMIVHKLARVLNGSADYDDNWHDIAGYATLAENDIKNRKSVKPD